MFHLFSFCGKLKSEGGFFTLETIGNKIRFLRKVANESQEELAKAANVSRISIGNYERNTRTPDPETLRLIADHYGVSLNFLVDTSISIDSFEDYKIQDFSDFLKELGTNWKTPINKGEYILNYKGFNDQIYTFRGSKNSVHNLFDLHDSLQIHNFMTKDRGLSIGGQIQPTYKGKALTPDIIEKIETILDTLLN